MSRSLFDRYPVVAYFCSMQVLSFTIDTFKSLSDVDQAATEPFLLGMMNFLEHKKTELNPNDRDGLKQCSEFATLVTHRALDLEAQGYPDTHLVHRMFACASQLFEICQQFDHSPELQPTVSRSSGSWKPFSTQNIPEWQLVASQARFKAQEYSSKFSHPLVPKDYVWDLDSVLHPEETNVPEHSDIPEQSQTSNREESSKDSNEQRNIEANVVKEHSTELVVGSTEVSNGVTATQETSVITLANSQNDLEQQSLPENVTAVCAAVVEDDSGVVLSEGIQEESIVANDDFEMTGPESLPTIVSKIQSVKAAMGSQLYTRDCEVFSIEQRNRDRSFSILVLDMMSEAKCQQLNFENVPQKEICLAFQNRKWRLLEEIIRFLPDIAVAIGCDNADDFFVPALSCIGYAAESNATDQSVCFFKRSLFEKSKLLRQQNLLCLVLNHIPSNNPFTLAITSAINSENEMDTVVGHLSLVHFVADHNKAPTVLFTGDLSSEQLKIAIERSNRNVVGLYAIDHEHLVDASDIGFSPSLECISRLNVPEHEPIPNMQYPSYRLSAFAVFQFQMISESVQITSATESNSIPVALTAPNVENIVSTIPIHAVTNGLSNEQISLNTTPPNVPTAPTAPSNIPTPTVSQPPPTFITPSARAQNSRTKAPTPATQPTPTATSFHPILKPVTVEQTPAIDQISTHTKYAVSALAFYDIDCALWHLRAALENLEKIERENS
eukprot:c9913_g1_i2.p1 GENE.c9913_g1_i2~~c9913_g1_i2.p1  ORF type:complete len:725 (-),score=202.76 c9913_g1_i2:1448-3622(-)